MNDNSCILECAPNFRVVCAPIALAGDDLVDLRLFRSDAVLAPSEADLAMIGNFGIDLVFDLRSGTERTRHPNRFWHSQGTKIIALDMLARIEGGADPWTGMRASVDAQGASSAMMAV